MVCIIFGESVFLFVCTYLFIFLTRRTEYVIKFLRTRLRVKSACVETGGFNADPEAPGSDERQTVPGVASIRGDGSWAGLRVPTNKYHNI